jgi:hypothetical protein
VVTDTRLRRWLWMKIVQRKFGRKVSTHRMNPDVMGYDPFPS